MCKTTPTVAAFFRNGSGPTVCSSVHVLKYWHLHTEANHVVGVHVLSSLVPLTIIVVLCCVLFSALFLLLLLSTMLV